MDADHTDVDHTDVDHTDAGHTDAGHTDAGHTDAGHADEPDPMRTEGGSSVATPETDTADLQDRLEAADPADAPDIAEALASRLARDLDDEADS